MKKGIHKKIIGVIGLLGVFIIFIFLLIEYNRKLEYKSIVQIQIGEKLPTIDSYIDKKEQQRIQSREIVWEDINEDSIYSAGQYHGYVEFRNKKIILIVEVVDNELPVIEGVQDITVYVNDNIDLLGNIKVSDNSHDDVNLEVVGEYDLSSSGEYDLSYRAADKSGNVTSMSFKLIVKEKEIPKENSPSNTTSKGYTILQTHGIYYVDGILIANKTYSLPSSYAPGGLDATFMEAFYRMREDAANQGIELSVISGYRSYNNQNSIYNNYVNRDGKEMADTYSARPGHSEHQTGLAADINSLYQDFINTSEGQWLDENCYRYGFIIRYPRGKESITGYMYEPWHIRYVGVPLASTLYNDGDWITLEEHFGITSKYSN